MPLVWLDQVFSYTGLLRSALNLFGHSEWAVRLMSGLAGALAVPATYRLARFVLSRRAALLAALLLCLSPLHITYSEEGAAYAIASPFLALFLINAVRLTREITPRNIIFTAIFAVITGLSHIYLVLFILIIFGLYAASNSDRRFTRVAIACMCAVSLMDAPQLVSFLSFRGTSQLESRPIDAWARSYPARIINSFVSGPLDENLSSWCTRDYYVPAVDSNTGSIPRTVAWMALATALFWAPFGAFSLARKNKHAAIWLTASGGYLLFLIFQSLVTHHAQIRYVVPVLPVLFILFASIADWPADKWTSNLGAVVMVALLVNFIVILNEDPPGKKWKPDIRTIAARVTEDCRTTKGVVLIDPEFTEVPLYAFYLDHSECKIIRQPAFEDYFYQGEKDQSLLYRTAEQKRGEDAWFGKYFSREGDAISVAYIVSQRDKDRANAIRDLIKPLFRHVEQSVYSDILIIKLSK